MQVKPGMIGQELLHAFAFMGGQVVHDDVNIPPSGLSHHDVGQERDELLAGMARRGFADDGAGLGVEGCIQREGAMPIVFKPVAFSASRRQGQDRVEPVEGLDMGFLVHAEDRGVLRGIHVKPNNVSGLRFKVWIIRRHVPGEPVRLQTGPFPDPRHHHVADAQLPGELAAAPVGRTIRWRLPCPRQNPCFRAGGALRHGPTAMAGIQPAQPGFQKPLLPAAHIPGIALDGLLNHRVGVPRVEHQEHPRPAHVFRPEGPRPHSSFQFASLLGGEVNNGEVWHASHHSR